MKKIDPQEFKGNGNGDPQIPEEPSREIIQNSLDVEKWKLEKDYRLREKAMELEIRGKARVEKKAKELGLKEMEIREKPKLSKRPDKWN